MERIRNRSRTNTALREGEPTADTRKSLLDRGLDWDLGVDLDRKLIFSNIVKTNLRPEVVLIVSSIRADRAMVENCGRRMRGRV